MAENSPVNQADAGHEVRTYFVRGRNALVARAAFGELFVDYFLHNGEQRIDVAEAHAELFKRALAGFVLHCASRPWNEMTAWTLHFQEPLLNIFLTGDNETGAVTGRVFAEGVREMESNLFYADVVRPRQPKRRSTTGFAGGDPLAAVEAFYRQSEQRPVRFFQIAEEEFVMVSSHPDCDAAWFDALTVDAVRALDRTETLALMERRIYRWHCGCNQPRMMEVLAPTMREDPEGLFGGEVKIEIRCPRCGARHVITREAMEAFVAEINTDKKNDGNREGREEREGGK
ncbi:Hsp33 family molecular chaperone HslO [Termitidicoccus mucosus]|uniref:Hsp33 family molecular chaperone HslO n=1 Tax=Termitidicoccus mucosus TaxID=1184151 RepID=UPI0008384007